MTKSQLIKALKAEISNSEYEEIKAGRLPHISRSNARIACEIMEDDSRSQDPVDEKEVLHLKEITYQFLEESWPDHPEAWKWVYLACVYNTYILGVPMHDREWVRYTTKNVDGNLVYYCPAKSRKADTNCTYCVCRYMEDV